ncbi:PIN domain-containing protein [Methylomagnum sp.]
MPGEIFIDSNIWLYALIEEEKPDPRRNMADRLIASIPQPTISTQVIREVSVNLLKKTAMTEPVLRNLVSRWYVDCRVAEATESQFLLASRLRECLALSYWDSLIVAAALETDCVTLYSEDMQHGQIINGRLTILNPFKAT